MKVKVEPGWNSNGTDGYMVLNEVFPTVKIDGEEYKAWLGSDVDDSIDRFIRASEVTKVDEETVEIRTP